ncbi:ComF family protein [Cellulomonas denverensis]|uniref:ComF family protein n=1 Tax=Cellulomonas denverensis TaxID=264297 RepID=A0A7X6KV66_9CELL|nr:ComF family protein [Cellulomonas denverensis]NKY22564.1 ComF family protein [Cellulomonas denverensis]GIG24791.1 hypothetical protein Cde04nite_10350 [Cellulomonas denverensis]
MRTEQMPGGEPSCATSRDVPRRTGPVADLLDLLLPATCASCELPGPVLCADCAAGWLPAPRRCEEEAGRLDRLDGHGPLPVWTQAIYQGAVRRTVLAWKDRGRMELTGWLARRTGNAAAAVAGELAALAAAVPAARAVHAGRGVPAVPAAPALGTVPAVPARPLLVVPAPPSAAGRRKRGEDLLRPVAAAVAAALTACGLPARAAPCLRTARGHRDQVGRGRRGRGLALDGGVALHRSAGRDPAFATGGHPVLLIDDVLTTGATLAACREILDRAGQRVVAALTLAATPAPTHSVHKVEPRAAPG